MNKIHDISLGELKGTLYKTGDGYHYKIRKGKTIIAQSYTYMFDKVACNNKMIDNMKIITGLNKTLFDVEKM